MVVCGGCCRVFYLDDPVEQLAYEGHVCIWDNEEFESYILGIKAGLGITVGN